MNGIDAGLVYDWICNTALSEKWRIMLILLGQTSGLYRQLQQVFVSRGVQTSLMPLLSLSMA